MQNDRHYATIKLIYTMDDITARSEWEKREFDDFLATKERLDKELSSIEKEILKNRI